MLLLLLIQVLVRDQLLCRLWAFWPSALQERTTSSSCCTQSPALECHLSLILSAKNNEMNATQEKDLKLVESHIPRAMVKSCMSKKKKKKLYVDMGNIWFRDMTFALTFCCGVFLERLIKRSIFRGRVSTLLEIAE